MKYHFCLIVSNQTMRKLCLKHDLSMVWALSFNLTHQLFVSYCLWHSLIPFSTFQAVWRHLWERKNGVVKEHRPHLLNIMEGEWICFQRTWVKPKLLLNRNILLTETKLMNCVRLFSIFVQFLNRNDLQGAQNLSIPFRLIVFFGLK